MKVSIGRIVLIVHVIKGEQTPRPAIVVMVHDNDNQAIDVQMFFDRTSGCTFLSDVRHETARALTPLKDVFWIWPPRES